MIALGFVFSIACAFSGYVLERQADKRGQKSVCGAALLISGLVGCALMAALLPLFAQGAAQTAW